MPDAVVLVEKFNGTLLEDEMYPSTPRPPVQAMQGQSPAQQFGYPPAPMQQGIGSLTPQTPMYGAYPSYMAQGGMTQGMPQMGPMAPQMPMDQNAPQYMADGGFIGEQGDMMQRPRMQQQIPQASAGRVGVMTADLARQMNNGTPEERMAALRQARGDGAHSGKGQMAQQGQQRADPGSFLKDFFMRMGKGANQQRAIGERMDAAMANKFPAMTQRAQPQEASTSGKGQRLGPQ